MYTTKNFRTKKELKEAVQAYNDSVYLTEQKGGGQIAPAVTYYQVGPCGGNEPRDGVFCCEGPHAPMPHRWYATCTAQNGRIIKVK